jgi:hypothetical protein
MSERRQHSYPCPRCNSSYHSVDMVCNTPGCGEARQEEKEFRGRNVREQVARVWDPKAHKYLPIEKGGLRHA